MIAPEQPGRSDGGAGTAVVTAGAKRLGRALCIRLAELGYDIALHYNSSSADAEKLVPEIKELGRNCQLFKANFSSLSEVRQLIPMVSQSMGTLTLLINNASVFVPNKLMTTTPEEFDTDVNVHIKAPFFLIQDFASQSGSGQIINIVDTAVTKCKTDYFSYLLTKKALYELTKMAAVELAPDIRVNSIAPGIIIPPAGIERQKYERLSTANPLHRPASPADVLVALEYLLKARQVTGECVFVDGGDQVDC